ncbi:MAG: hypothetical protein DRR08_22045 [Candidatus Parabeggiatoa sp. nov. 2]|nr:MAG: hypothetical protein B6247_10360 [Beggiatoa sp. 4572_84]RKZ56312.1 MAG: hypothetical protein DRR08_22045 [Gammaproteobacteria bacterium]
MKNVFTLPQVSLVAIYIQPLRGWRKFYTDSTTDTRNKRIFYWRNGGIESQNLYYEKSYFL